MTKVLRKLSLVMAILCMTLFAIPVSADTSIPFSMSTEVNLTASGAASAMALSKSGYMFTIDSAAPKVVSIYDIVDPKNPTKADELSYGDLGAGGLLVRDNYLFVRWAYTIVVYNVADINDICICAKYDFTSTGNSLYDWTVDDNCLYLVLSKSYGANGSIGLVILNASDDLLKNGNEATVLTEMYNGGTDQTIGAGSNIWVDGNWIYMTTQCLGSAQNPRPGALLVFDAGDRTNPVLKGYTQIKYDKYYVQFSGVSCAKDSDYVYISAQDGRGDIAGQVNGIYVVDVKAAKEDTYPDPTESEWKYLDLSANSGMKRVADVLVNGDFLFVQQQDARSTSVFRIPEDDPVNSGYEALYYLTGNGVYGGKFVQLSGKRLCYLEKNYGSHGAFKIYKLPDSAFTAFGIDKSGDTIKSVVGMTNYSADDMKLGKIVLATYSDTKLTGVQAADVVIPAGQAMYNVYTESLNAPSAEGESAKTFILSDFKNIKAFGDTRTSYYTN